MSLPCFISSNRVPRNASNATRVSRVGIDQYWGGKRQKPIKHQASCRLLANQSSYRHKVQMHWWKLKLCEDKGMVLRNCKLEIVPKCKCVIYCRWFTRVLVSACIYCVQCDSIDL